MNNKTARLLRRYAIAEDQHSYRQCKRLWNKIPRNRRADCRKRMKDALGQIP